MLSESVDICKECWQLPEKNIIRAIRDEIFGFDVDVPEDENMEEYYHLPRFFVDAKANGFRSIFTFCPPVETAECLLLNGLSESEDEWDAPALPEWESVEIDSHAFE